VFLLLIFNNETPDSYTLSGGSPRMMKHGGWERLKK